MGYLLQALTVFITGSYYMYYIGQWDIYYRHLLYLLQALTVLTTGTYCIDYRHLLSVLHKTVGYSLHSPLTILTT